MPKVDLKITLHFKGENPNYKKMSIDEMNDSLDRLIDALIPDNTMKYKAKMENLNTGDTIDKSN